MRKTDEFPLLCDHPQRTSRKPGGKRLESRKITLSLETVCSHFVTAQLSPADLTPALEDNGDWYIDDVGGRQNLVSSITSD